MIFGCIAARRPLKAIACVAATFVSLGSAAVAQAPWRSALYPADWAPGYKDGQGRFLHDFGYAGYRRGEAPIPAGPPNGAALVVNVVKQFGADNTGATDTTVALQRALDAVGTAGGGVVHLPAGVYQIQPQGPNNYALWIKHDNVVLRGAGAGKTFLYNAATFMRDKSVLLIAPAGGGSWLTPLANTTAAITQDLPEPTRQIPVADVAGFTTGDWVVVRASATDAFIAEHGMTGWWTPAGSAGPAGPDGPTFYRQITAVDAGTNTLTIDIPTRYYLKMRDGARVYKVAPHIAGVGVEDFSIGNRQNPKTTFGDLEFGTAGTGAYDVHNSVLVRVQHALDGWVQRIASYRPAANAGDFHLLSNGLRVTRSRSITVRGCDIRKPQYEGEGGNGYAFTIQSGDCLYQDLSTESARHSYVFQYMATSGNVLHRCASAHPRLATDFHMHLSMANLLDNMTLTGDFIDAKVRPYGGPTWHGVTTTQSVIWNTRGTSYPVGRNTIIDSRQFGWGYVIGTQGPAYGVQTTPTLMTFPSSAPTTRSETAPEDWVEGAGLGTLLEPASLYEDQRARRDQTYVAGEDAVACRGGAAFKITFPGFTETAANAATLFFYVTHANRTAPAGVKIYGYAGQDGDRRNAVNGKARPGGAICLGEVTLPRPGWYALDVTGYVNTQMSDKTATFELAGEANADIGITLYSRENEANKPYLQLTR